jgi:hypothetical protein
MDISEVEHGMWAFTSAVLYELEEGNEALHLTNPSLFLARDGNGGRQGRIHLWWLRRKGDDNLYTETWYAKHSRGIVTK